MADGVRTRIKLPKSITANVPFTVKTLITHQMESGQRVDAAGAPLPRSIIHRFVCSFDGETALDVDMLPGISTNPYFEFHLAVPHSGHLTFTWYDDDGAIYEDSAEVVLG